MQRRNSQVRVVSPERDSRMGIVRDAIARSGLPEPLPAYAETLAEGYIARLRRRVYEALNDVIGTGDDLEALCGWRGAPRTLAVAMQRAGYVKDICGVLVMVDAVNEAPEYLKKRWMRSN